MYFFSIKVWLHAPMEICSRSKSTSYQPLSNFDLDIVTTEDICFPID